MTASDYILDIVLIGIVVLQIHGRRLSAFTLVLPIAISAYIASHYLQGIPTSGNSMVLVAACTAIGVALGAGAGCFTRVFRKQDGRLWAQAGVTAAVLWVLGTGTRLAFQLYASHGGGKAIVDFSTAHHISMQAWVAALILMAIAEASTRTVVICARAFGPELLDKLTGRPAAPALGSSH